MKRVTKAVFLLMCCMMLCCFCNLTSYAEEVADDKVDIPAVDCRDSSYVTTLTLGTEVIDDAYYRVVDGDGNYHMYVWFRPTCMESYHYLNSIPFFMNKVEVNLPVNIIGQGLNVSMLEELGLPAKYCITDIYNPVASELLGIGAGATVDISHKYLTFINCFDTPVTDVEKQEFVVFIVSPEAKHIGYYVGNSGIDQRSYELVAMNIGFALAQAGKANWYGAPAFEPLDAPDERIAPSDYTGLYMYNGSFVYVTEGKWNHQFSGFVDYNGETFYVEEGMVANGANGLIQNPENKEWYFTASGQVQKNYTGLAQYDNAWFYVTEGRLDTTIAGCVEYNGSLFYVGAGRIMMDVNGLVQDPVTKNWYFLANGQVQTQYTGLALYDGEWFYIVNGILQTGQSEITDYDGSKFLIAAGRVQYSYSGLFKNADGKWYFISRGQVQTGYTGEIIYDGATFMVKNGMVVD